MLGVAIATLQGWRRVGSRLPSSGSDVPDAIGCLICAN